MLDNVIPRHTFLATDRSLAILRFCVRFTEANADAVAEFLDDDPAPEFSLEDLRALSDTFSKHDEAQDERS